MRRSPAMRRAVLIVAAPRLAGCNLWLRLGDALAIYGEAELLFVGAGPAPFGAASAIVGVSYQRR